MKDNNIKFVSYNIGLAMKEVGYDGLYCIKDFDLQNKRSLHDSSITTYENEEDRVSAPTYSQAFDWFFDEYGLHVEFSFDDMQWVGRVGEFCIPDFAPDEFVCIDESEGYESAKKDKAVIKLKCLEKMIEIVKNKK